jgi:hypothetical protein
VGLIREGTPMTRRNDIPPAVTAHEHFVLLPIPIECCKCHAGPGALLDDEIGHLSCRLCGWEFLYIRSAAWPAEVTMARRRRGRAAWPTT